MLSLRPARAALCANRHLSLARSRRAPPARDEFPRARPSDLANDREGSTEMGKIVVTEFVSLDGVLEEPGGAEDFKYGGWTFAIDRGADGNKFKGDEGEAAEALLLGRKT